MPAASAEVKLLWKGKEFRKKFTRDVERGLEDSGFKILAEVQRLIQVPGRGKRYQHPTAGAYRASMPGQALKSPTGKLLNAIEMEVAPVALGMAVRVGIGPTLAGFAAGVGREMMLGKNARAKGQRPTIRPALEKLFPVIVKDWQRAAKAAR